MSCNEKYNKVKIGDVCEVKGGKRLPKGEELTENPTGYPYIRLIDIKNNKVDKEKVLYINKEVYTKISKYRVQENDVCLAIVGNTIGLVFYISKEEDGFNLTENAVRITNLDNKRILNKYLYYYMLSSYGQHQISSKQVGSAQGKLPIKNIRDIEVILQPIEIQKRVADILSSLDDKIELNDEMNETLEEMAQALFKRWFVDFEFPNDEGEPYKSSGGEMVESELGMIPKGWGSGCLVDLVNIKYGKDHKKLEGGIIPVFGSGGIMRRVNKSLYEKESVLIPRKGTLNNVMYVNEPFWSVDTMFFTEMKRPNVAKFVYQFIKLKDLASMNMGSAVPSMTTAILNSMKVVIPSTDLLNKFDEIITTLYTKIEFNNKNTQSLVEARDSLLPKLMSGEIRVEEIEANL